MVPHRIVVCTSCRNASDGTAGQTLLAKLADGLSSGARATCGTGFSLSEVRCMAGCARACTVAFQAEGKASYLFGDIDPETDVAALLAFATQYAGLSDGWCSASSRPLALLDKTLARLPAFAAPCSPLPAQTETAR
jgi:predicted metal-binding protein